MAGDLKWDDAKLRAAVSAAERRAVTGMAAHWTRAAQKKVSVSAGGASKLARSVRRTKGALTGPLLKEHDRVLKSSGSRVEARRAAAKLYERFRHSKPGEPPRAITTFGLKNIVWRLARGAASGATARAGLFRNALYMYFLETGFTLRRHGRAVGRVAPRPWMKKTLDEERGALRALRRRS